MQRRKTNYDEIDDATLPSGSKSQDIPFAERNKRPTSVTPDIDLFKREELKGRPLMGRVLKMSGMGWSQHARLL